MKFSEHFQINRTQLELDFVDRQLRNDLRLFIDPLRIATESDLFSRECKAIVRSFFQKVVDLARAEKDSEALLLLAQLTEPRETGLGWSNGSDHGSGLGNEGAVDFYNKLKKSKALQTGMIEDIEVTAMLVHGIDKDIISDMLTKLIMNLLCQYTASQCVLWGVPMKHNKSYKSWNASKAEWVDHSAQLPEYAGEPLVLVPKALVCHRLSMDANKFTTFVMDQIDQGDPRMGVRLAELLRDRDLDVPRNKKGKLIRQKSRELLKDIAKGSKNLALEFAQGDNNILKKYRENQRKNSECMTDSSIEAKQPNPKPLNITDTLNEIRGRTSSASPHSDFHLDVIAGITASLHPLFKQPSKFCEQEDTEVFTVSNAASRGVLYKARKFEQNGTNTIERRPNLLIVTINEHLDGKKWKSINIQQLLADSQSGGALLVAKSVSKSFMSLQNARGRTGIYILDTETFNDLLDIGSGEDGIALAIDVFEELSTIS